MLVHRRVTPSHVRVKRVAQEHNTMSLARTRTRTTRSGVERIKSQVHEPPDETEIHAAQREMCQVKNRYLKKKLDQVTGSVSGKTLRAVDLATQKDASSWLTVVPIRDMNFDLNKSEFRDAVKLRRKCFAWCAVALKLNQFYKTSQEKS